MLLTVLLLRCLMSRSNVRTLLLVTPPPWRWNSTYSMSEWLMHMGGLCT
jgi:hypothetical protein